MSCACSQTCRPADWSAPLAEVCGELLGTSFSLTVPQDVAPRLLALLPRPEPAAGPGLHLGVAEDLGEALARVNETVLARCRGLAFHAGVVARGSSAVIVPAASGRGKSTLVAALLQRGLDYASDEALVVEWQSGEVRTYPKWLSLSPWSVAALGLPPARAGADAYGPDELGAGLAHAPLEPGHIVLLGDAGGLVELPRARGAQALLGMAFNAYRDPQAAYDAAVSVARRSRTWQLGRRHPAEMADLLADVV